ncbi:MAG TPA: STAS domain-containing protein [Bryobacteraceae bacterium]|jgi:anti-sigma B factor antagonist|nr:STAS domain-containing protein [Bryobacteraceae bacterium]
MNLKLNTRRTAGITVVAVSGRLTLGEGAPVVRREIHALLASGERNILMNLAEVTYMDSSGLGELVADLTEIENAGGTLKLAGLTRGTKELLRITRLSSLFDVYETEAEAMRSFA